MRHGGRLPACRLLTWCALAAAARWRWRRRPPHRLVPCKSKRHDHPPSPSAPAAGLVVPTHDGRFAPGAAAQDVFFTQPATGRQFCLEALSAFDGKLFAAAAEIAVLDTKGEPINQSSWTIAYASSEDTSSEDGSALNAINGQISDHWHTAYIGKALHPAHPHRLIIDFGVMVEVAGARYTPRQGASGVTGRIWQYRMYVGNSLASEP